MTEVNWNLLDTSAPSEVVNAYDWGGEFYKGRNQASARQAAEQQMKTNALDMQIKQQTLDAAPALAARQAETARLAQQGARLKNEADLQEVRMAAADRVSVAPKGLVFQAFVQEAQNIAKILSIDPAESIAYGEQLMAAGGEDALIADARKHSLEAKDRISKISMQNAGKQIVPYETNPNAPGFTGTPIATTTTPGQDAAAATARMQDATAQQRIAASNRATANNSVYGMMTDQGLALLDKSNANNVTMARGPNGEILMNPYTDPNSVSKTAAAKTTGASGAAYDFTQFQAAEEAPREIKKLDDLIVKLEMSDAITGPAAELITRVNQVKAFFGDDIANGKVTDTQMVNAMMGRGVFSMLQAMGLTSKQMDTPEERKFMQQMLTGEISMNKDTLIQMAKMRKAEHQSAIDRWDKKVESGRADRTLQALGESKPEASAEKWKAASDDALIEGL